MTRLRPLLALLLAAPLAVAADPPKPDVLLNPAQVELLKKQKVLTTDTTFPQVFTPYLRDEGVPVFITSDTILNAFHVLFEESMVRREERNARLLPDALRKLLVELPDEARSWDIDEAAMAAVRSRAERVIGVALRLMDPKAGDFGAGAEKAVMAEVGRIRAGQGGATDSGRFNPTGIYARNESLRNYWRATAWLQAISLRLDRDDDFLTAALLARAGRWSEANDRLDPFGRFLSHGFDAPVGSLVADRHYSRGKLTTDDLTAWRKAALDRRAKRLGPVAAAKRDPAVRLMPKYYLPEAGLFDVTGGPNRWPSGSELAAALGSPAAQEHLTKSGPKGLPEAIVFETGTTGWPNPAEPTFPPSDKPLHTQYLACLQTLLTAEPANAPAFMTSAAWQGKQCQTALAGWALQRQPWAVRAARAVPTADETRKPVGLVEPVPEFYDRLAELCRRCQIEFDGLDPKGEIRDPATDLGGRWKATVDITRTLSALGRKQLRNEEFTAEDARFVGQYGPALAALMFLPGDDAPRVASVFSNPVEKKSLFVGTARPRAMYVLYPWGDNEVLCRGAVMTYREFTSAELLSDAAWRTRLTGPNAPAAPDWLK